MSLVSLMGGLRGHPQAGDADAALAGKTTGTDACAMVCGHRL